MTGLDRIPLESEDRSSKPVVELVIAGATQVLTCVASCNDALGPVNNGTVAISGDRIIAVGPAEEVADQVDATLAQVIDAGGRIVAPGFID